MTLTIVYTGTHIIFPNFLTYVTKIQGVLYETNTEFFKKFTFTSSLKFLIMQISSH